MSDEYSIAGNFQRASDDPRAADEYEYRMARVRERTAEREAAERYGRRLREAAESRGAIDEILNNEETP